jgi:hypothetical protein
LKGQKTAGGTLSQDSPSIKSKKKKKKAHLWVFMCDCHEY